MAVPFYLPDDVGQMGAAAGAATGTAGASVGTASSASSPTVSPSVAANLPSPNASNNSGTGSSGRRYYHHHPHHYHLTHPASVAAQTAASSSANSSTASTPSTSYVQPQAPLQSPVNGEYLVQAFCEALNRYSRGGASPGYTMTPPSPTCSPHQTFGEIFFPAAAVHYTPGTPRTPVDFNNQRMPSRQCRMVPSRMNFRINSVSRYRLNSAGEPDEEGYDYPNEYDSDEHWDEHFNYITAREQLQEFPGRVPSRKKKSGYHYSSCSSSSNSSSSSAAATNGTTGAGSSSSKNKSKSKSVQDAAFSGWPTIFTAVVIALGCGILVSR